MRAKPLLDPLRLPCLICDQLREGVGGGTARGLTLVSRGLLRHRAFYLQGIAETDRLGALQAQLAAWQAFPDAQYLVLWQGDVAQAYAVERQRLADAPVKAATWLPESLARVPGDEGLRLVQALDGVEGQAWRAGLLHASRWWAKSPSLQEWQQFLRQSQWSGLPAEAVPALESPAWVKPKQLPIFSDALGQSRQGNEAWLASALLLVLLGIAAMSARVLWDGFEERREAQAAIAELREQVAPVLVAREKALAAADQSGVLISQLQAPQPLEVLEELLRLLPKASLLRELDANGLELRVLLDLSPEVSRGKVISDLESSGWFTQLGEAKDGQARSGLDLHMKLSGPRPPKRSNSDTGLQRLASDSLPPVPKVESKQGVRP